MAAAGGRVDRRRIASSNKASSAGSASKPAIVVRSLEQAVPAPPVPDPVRWYTEARAALGPSVEQVRRGELGDTDGAAGEDLRFVDVATKERQLGPDDERIGHPEVIRLPDRPPRGDGVRRQVGARRVTRRVQGGREQASRRQLTDQLAVAAVDVGRRGDGRGVVAVQRGQARRPGGDDLVERIVGDARIERGGPRCGGARTGRRRPLTGRPRGRRTDGAWRGGRGDPRRRPPWLSRSQRSHSGRTTNSSAAQCSTTPVGVAGGEAVGQVEQPASDVGTVAVGVEVGEVADDQAERQLVAAPGQCVVDRLGVPALLARTSAPRPRRRPPRLRRRASSRRSTSASRGW